MCNRIWAELGFKSGGTLHQQCRQKSILSKREQILLVQRVDVGPSVFLDDAVGGDDRSTLVCSPNAVRRETTRQTGGRTEE